jgi:thioredoxin reductase (NADPH)
MATSDPRKVIIIGSGPAGLTAGIYTARANLKPLCFEGFNAGGLIPGGQLMFTTDVENYPGFDDSITGPELMQRFRGQAERQGCELETADVTKVDFSQRPFKIWVDDDLHLADAVIVATGARANYLGLDNEDKLKNRGVSACAVCDGGLFRNKPVTVVGGGDTALEEAGYLSGLCSEVTLIHRRDEFRASEVMGARARSNPKINLLLSHTVVDVLDVEKEEVTGLMLKNLKTGEVFEHKTDALFVAIGHTPMTELFMGQLDTHDNGYLKVTPGTTQTSVEGVFAAGDVMDWTFRQAVTAAGTGCMAALETERWLGGQAGH